MKRILTLLVLLVPSLAIADCPESENYSYHSLTQSGFGVTSPNCRYQLQVNITGVGASYLFVGYQSGSFIHNGDETIFKKIPKAEFDSDPYLRGFYRGYMSGELIADIHTAYNQPNPNGTIDLLSYEGDDFLACEEPPATGGALDLGELIPWLSYLAMIGTVIAIASTFSFSLKVWDLILRAKNNPNFWCLFFVLVLPSIASAQGSICHKVPVYGSYTTSFNQTGNSNSFTFNVSFTDGFSSSITILHNGGIMSVYGNDGFSGIPYDVMLSDATLRNLWNGYMSGYLQDDLRQASLNGGGFSIGVYPEHPLVHCGCAFDTSNPTCPAYEPSGPDVPVYCGDGETEDTAPDDPDCGCPGQDYTTCDNPGCPDADNDLCCDEIDPKPDDPNCTCTRAGPEGDCDSCPQCEKLLTEYMEDYKELFKEYGVDLSPFLGRGTSSSSMAITIPAPQGRFWWIFNQASWQFGIDENSVYPGALQNVVGTMRLVFRSLLLVLVLWIFTRSILRVVLR